MAFEIIFFYRDFFSSAPWSLAGLSVKKKEMVGGLLDELGHLQLWWLDWRSSRPTPTNAWNFGYSPICLGWNPSFKFRGAIASAWPDSKWCKAHRSWTLGWHTIITDGRSQPLEYIEVGDLQRTCAMLQTVWPPSLNIQMVVEMKKTFYYAWWGSFALEWCWRFKNHRLSKIFLFKESIYNKDQKCSII